MVLPHSGIYRRGEPPPHFVIPAPPSSFLRKQESRGRRLPPWREVRRCGGVTSGDPLPRIKSGAGSSPLPEGEGTESHLQRRISKPQNIEEPP